MRIEVIEFWNHILLDSRLFSPELLIFFKPFLLCLSLEHFAFNTWDVDQCRGDFLENMQVFSSKEFIEPKKKFTARNN